MISDELKATLKHQSEEMFTEVIEKNGYQVNASEIEGRNVLDIGANIGCFSVLAASLGAKRILSFEPDRDNFEKLYLNTKDYPSVHPLRLAVFNGLSDTAYLSKSGSGCEVSETNTNREIQLVTLGQAVALLPPSDNDLVLKIDIEGSEYDVLYYAGGSLLRRFKTIFIELHSKDKERVDTQNIGALNHYLSAAETLKRFFAFCGYKRLHTYTIFWFLDGNANNWENGNAVHVQEVAKFERL